MNLDRRFVVWALGYAVAGLVLGIYMAASQNHGEMVTHAHILMIGFVLSLVYGIIHKLWLTASGSTVAKVQFVLHQAAAIVISVGLFLFYGNLMPQPTLDPILAVASFGVLLAMLLMLYMVIRSGTARAV